MIESILEDSPDTKRCSFKDCENYILASSEFPYCEVCRALSLRNSLAILSDPCSPISDRREMVFHTAVHLMRPDEVLNAIHKLEWVYLELQKQLKSKELETYRAKKFQEGVELVAGERSKPTAPKTKKTREKKADLKKQKLEQLLGDGARKLLGELPIDDMGF